MRALGKSILLALAIAAFIPSTASAQIAGLPPQPIPGPSLSQPTAFEGSEATPAPVSAGRPPRHPFMAPNERSNIHNDAYMTDAYTVSGPLGRDIAVSSTLFFRECGSITFDSQGRLVTVCVGIDRPVLAMLDPKTLAVLAAMPLPLRNPQTLVNLFTDFSGGGYFYLDDQDRAVVPTTDHHILVVAEAPGPSFVVENDYDLSAVVPDSEGIVSVLPDWSGRLWFVSRGGLVGTIDRDSGAVKTMRLEGEGISNSFSVDESGGVFIVSDKALYRFDAGPGGEPAVSWREVYPNSGVHKPGQSDAGSGTTPTLFGPGLVAITDNADPMDVVVYERGRQATSPRLVCTEPVFAQGAGATDQSLIATDDALIAENNYGYAGPRSTEFGGTTSPGIARVNVIAGATPSPTLAGVQTKAKKKKKKKKKRKHRRRHRRKHGSRGRVMAPRQAGSCSTAWTSEERAPSVVPKLSLGNGLVYTYTKPKRDDGADAWYFTALDFRSGETVFRRLAGEGLGFNNNYAPVTLGPDGAAYVGVLGGVIRLADSAT